LPWGDFLSTPWRKWRRPLLGQDINIPGRHPSTWSPEKREVLLYPIQNALWMGSLFSQIRLRPLTNTGAKKSADFLSIPVGSDRVVFRLPPAGGSECPASLRHACI
jgi:hypothetical protein